jgi:hypothetical protein
MTNKISKSFSDKVSDKKEPCSDFVLRLLKEANQALTYEDFGKKFSRGTLRNTLSNHTKQGNVLKLPKECPARFILPQWAHRPEYSCVQKNDKKGKAGKIDFMSLLKFLPWETTLGVHNLKLSFEVYNLHWIDNCWRYSPKSQSYSQLLNLSYPVRVQCYDTGTVLVSVKSSCKPFKLDLIGLIALTSLLGEVRCKLHSPCIPEPANWLVVQWHLNRDSEKIELSGLDFHITFRDFFNEAARIYYKHELSKVRAEVNQSPNQTLREVFEDILNRDNNAKGDSA